MTDRSPAPLPEQPRGLVFDLDGTLVDSYRAIATSLNHARSRHGLAPLSINEIRLRVGRGLENLIAELVGPAHVNTGVRCFRRRYAEVFTGMTRSLPGVEPTLRRLHDAGLRLSVASNKPARFSVPILKNLGLHPLFDAVHGPDTTGSTKPEPAMIRACLASMQLTPQDCVYVGDMALDAVSGERAGLSVVLVAGGSSPGEHLRQTGCPVLASLSELPRLLKLAN